MYAAPLYSRKVRLVAECHGVLHAVQDVKNHSQGYLSWLIMEFSRFAIGVCGVEIHRMHLYPEIWRIENIITIALEVIHVP